MPKWTLKDAQDVAMLAKGLHEAVGFPGMPPDLLAAIIRMGDRVREVTDASGGEIAARAELGLPPQGWADRN